MLIVLLSTKFPRSWNYSLAQMVSKLWSIIISANVSPEPCCELVSFFPRSHCQAAALVSSDMKKRDLELSFYKFPRDIL